MPTVLAIILNVQAALQAIAAADGYNTTVRASSVVIDPIDLATVNATDVPFLVVGDYTPGERDFATSRPVAIKDRFTLTLAFRIDALGTDRARKETAAWQLVADIETALAKDPQRGQKALYTYVQQPEIYPGPPTTNQVYGEVPVEITLQRAYGQP
jgi:hypothetical protein